MKSWQHILEETPLPNDHQKVFIWGAGNTAVLAHQGMLRENLYEEFRVDGYVDTNNASTELNGFPVMHPDTLREYPPEDLFILICTGRKDAFQDIQESLQLQGIEHCLLDAAIMRTRWEKYLHAAELLDSISQGVYYHLLEKRLTLDPVDASIYAGESYFGIPEFCISSSTDVVLDCGAYVGDSTERYLWRMDKYQKVIALEPDPNNYRALSQRFERLRREWGVDDDTLVALFAGVNSQTSSLSVDTRVGGLGSIAVSETSNHKTDITFWSVDDLFTSRFPNTPPTFIKADIESYEYHMLQGAKYTIKRFTPRLAICMYHNAIDMFDIPLLVHSLNDEYRLAIRHHSYGLAETVLYAY